MHGINTWPTSPHLTLPRPNLPTLRKMHLHLLTTLALLGTTLALFQPCLSEGGHNQGEVCQGTKYPYVCSNNQKHVVSSPS
jgi:hypothetical protein